MQFEGKDTESPNLQRVSPVGRERDSVFLLRLSLSCAFWQRAAASLVSLLESMACLVHAAVHGVGPSRLHPDIELVTSELL